MVSNSILPVRRLSQYDVVNPQGDDLGQVQTLMLDMSQGRIAFVVVAFGGVLGLTDKWFALPWEILAWSPETKKIVLNMPREVLENAPGLDKTKWPDEIDLSWLRSCYVHYGCAPYWETPAVTESHVRQLAYSIWETEGRPDGKDLEHYYRAEAIIGEQESKGRTPREFISIKV